MSSSPDIFFSLRFNATGPMKEAQLLQAENIVGGNIEDEVIYKLDQCKLAVLFATADYGAKGSVSFSTHEELAFILQEKKPFFLIKMCDKYNDAKTRFKLTEAISHVDWRVGNPMPADLVSKLLTKYESAGGVASVPSLTTSFASAASVSETRKPDVTHVVSSTPTSAAAQTTTMASEATKKPTALSVLSSTPVRMIKQTTGGEARSSPNSSPSSSPRTNSTNQASWANSNKSLRVSTDERESVSSRDSMIVPERQSMFSRITSAIMSPSSASTSTRLTSPIMRPIATTRIKVANPNPKAPLGSDIKLREFASKGKLKDIHVMVSSYDISAIIDAVDSDGRTALFLASLKGHVEVMQLLLDCGANVNTTINNKSAVLYVASEFGHTAVVRVLLDYGAIVDTARSTDGITALYIASDQGHLEIVKVLLSRGANVNVLKRPDSTSVLHTASAMGHARVVIELLLHGANIKATNNDGSTALHLACQYGHEEVVKVLLDRGANVKTVNKNGLTPLKIAKNHSSIVALLVAKGGK